MQLCRQTGHNNSIRDNGILGGGLDINCRILLGVGLAGISMTKMPLFVLVAAFTMLLSSTSLIGAKTASRKSATSSSKRSSTNSKRAVPSNAATGRKPMSSPIALAANKRSSRSVINDRGSQYPSSTTNINPSWSSPPSCQNPNQDIDDVPPPQFLLVSCAKCGSTALYHQGICQHPRISCQAKIKVRSALMQMRSDCLYMVHA